MVHSSHFPTFEQSWKMKLQKNFPFGKVVIFVLRLLKWKKRFLLFWRDLKSIELSLCTRAIYRQPITFCSNFLKISKTVLILILVNGFGRSPQGSWRDLKSNELSLCTRARLKTTFCSNFLRIKSKVYFINYCSKYM